MTRKTLLLIFASVLCLSLNSQCIIIGADLSYVNTVESKGGIYRDSNGSQVDPYALFATRGANMVRMRLWHTPENIIDQCGNPISTNNLDDVVLAFQRTKAEGMDLHLAIHYGDYFNDPGKQRMPQAWQGLSHNTLLDSIYEYTYSVLQRLQNEEVLPAIVAIGNETTWGFIDETAATDGWSWPEDAEKFNTALSAVDDFNNANNATVKKAIHFTDETASWLTGLFQDQNIFNFDIIGISFYPIWTEFNSVQELGALINQLKNDYNKEIMVFETGAPWTTSGEDSYSNFMNNFGNLNYPVSQQGQKDFLLDLAATVYQNGGTGLLYWEPAWVSSQMCDIWGQGSSYENVGFFDFNNDNIPLPAFDVFDYCNTITSVVSIGENENILISPNPATDLLKIEGPVALTKIVIMDNSGREIKKTFIQQNIIDVSHLHQGLYFISFFIENKIIVKKVIKK